MWTQFCLLLWPLALCFGSVAHHTCVVMSSIFSSVLMKYNVVIQRPARWYDPGKCEVTPSSFPKCNINHEWQSAIQGRAVHKVNQHLLSTWIRKVKSLPFWFNVSVSLILLQCDSLITMIRISGTYVQYLFFSSFIAAAWASHTFTEKVLFKMWST